MNSKKSISRKFLITVFVITTLTIALLATVSIFVKYNEYKKECELITETYIKEQEIIVKYEVERTVNDIEYKIRSSGHPLESIKRIPEQLEKIRFPNKGKEPGIFFVRSYDGILMMSVSKPELVGKDVSQNKDSDGILTHKLFMSIVNESGGGFADYSWFNPFTEKDQRKRSFIKGMPELQWYIGAGFWFEDINSVIDAKRTDLKKDVQTYMIIVVLIILVLYIIIFIISRNLSGKISDSFKKFSLFFSKAATQHAFIEKENLHYFEFKELADSANQMISERVKAEEDVRIMAHAFKSISDCVTITDLENNLLYVNESFLKTYGYVHKEIVGKKIDLFGSLKNPHGFHNGILQETLKGGWKGELWNTRKNGSEFQISLSATPIKKNNGEIIALVGVSKDITERKRTELLQKIIYNISQAANTAKGLDKLIEIIKDQLHQIIDIKNFYVAFYNEDDDTFTSPYMLDENDNFISWPAGKSFTAYVYRAQKPVLLTKDEMKRLEKSGEVEFVGTVPEVWLGVPLKIKGKTYGVFAVQNYENKDAYTEKDLEMLEFVSHQMSISIERKKAESELLIAYEKAMESDRLKSAFLATVSHELRTPLNAIIGFTDLIGEKLEMDTILNYAEIVNSSGHHLLEIIEGIFDVTLLEVGQVRLVKELHSLDSIMQSVDEIIQVEQLKINSSIEVRYERPQDENDILIYTDKLKLKQILINLLKNALKFTHEGYIEYGYEKIKENGISSIRFYVKDTGIGIAKDKQDFIFNIFRQVDETLTRYYGGTGIGLFVVKRFTEILGGKVDLESEKRKGSTFYITLPYSEPGKINDEVKLESELTDTISFTDKTILIAEDDEVSTKLLIEVLKNLKTNYITAKNGNEAVKVCSENLDIDLVLMDIKMPDMSGYEATKLIKKTRPELIVVAQTAHAVPGDKEKALKAGCDDYISKPIVQDDLLGIIQNLLKEQ